MAATTLAEQHPDILPLLESQLQHAGTLSTLLQAEYQALLTSDLATLAALVSAKHSAAALLEQCSTALAEHTGGAPHAVIPQLGEEAMQCWQQLGQVADTLRQQNLSNGALLNERQNRLRWVAERAGGESRSLYGPRPSNSFSASLSGRSLARA